MKKPLKAPTDRSFGFTFAVVCGFLGASLLWKSSAYASTVLGAAAALAVVAVAVPGVLHPLNIAWTYFGLLLSKIVSPIVMGIIFFGIFTPVATLFRIRKRDALRRAFERELRTYWIDRTPPGPDGKTLPRQF